MNLTKKQKAILALIVKANPDGPIDFDQLIERVPYTPTKDSMHFSIRALVAKGLIEKGPLSVRRGRARRLISPTPLGQHWAAALCPKPVATTLEEAIDMEAYVEAEKEFEDELDERAATIDLK